MNSTSLPSSELSRLSGGGATPRAPPKPLVHIRGAGAQPERRDVAAHVSSLPRTPMRSLTDVQQVMRGADLKLDSSAPDINQMELRDVKEVSYVSRRRMDAADFDPNEVDEDGLPLVYNEQRIAGYWKNRPGELLGRWTRFTAIAAPWLTKLANAFLSGRLPQEATQAELARDAVANFEKLGPTFIKLGQILSIRPDVLPPGVMKELATLQDRITPFSTQEARQMVEKELGQPLDEVFSEFSERPIAAASLAQVYRARLRGSGEEVAVKVQRPGALATISKDLYVMRRAVGVYEQLVRRFTAQTTDYYKLLSTFAEGLYTEMDFRNEALNQSRMQQLLDASEFGMTDIVIPRPFMELTTRRVLVMEWVSGVKLTTLQPDEIRTLVKIGQAAFLTQLLEVGFFHGDPHPGNLLKVTEGPHAGKLALLDFGLVAEIPGRDREAMVSATIHLANRDWDALINDFIALGFLPPNSDRGLIIPVMERVLSPYLRGGGAKAFNYQALSQDLLAATLEIPFSVPPYMSLLARSVATLEGIALTGDPGYQLVAEAYPFVVRKVLRNDSTGSSALLRDILYDSTGHVKATRLSAMLNASLGYVADSKASQGFIDFDAVPSEGASVRQLITFLCGPEARELRPLLVDQLVGGFDLFIRDRLRRAYTLLPSLAPRLPFIGAILPPPPAPPVPVPGLGLLSAEQFLAKFAPPLNQGEEVYLASLLELSAGLLGVSVAELESPSIPRLIQLVLQPNVQIKELADALEAITGDATNRQAVEEVAVAVVDRLAALQAQRAEVPVETLFGPGLRLAKRGIKSISESAGRMRSGGSASSTSTSTVGRASMGGATAAGAAGGEAQAAVSVATVTATAQTDEGVTVRSRRSVKVVSGNDDGGEVAPSEPSVQVIAAEDITVVEVDGDLQSGSSALGSSSSSSSNGSGGVLSSNGADTPVPSSSSSSGNGVGKSGSAASSKAAGVVAATSWGRGSGFRKQITMITLSTEEGA